MKKQYLLALILVLVLTSCTLNPEKRKVISATVDTACLAKTFSEERNPMKMKELPAQMEAVFTENGFESKEEFQTVASKYEGDEKMKTEIEKKAMKQCGADLSEMSK